MREYIQTDTKAEKSRDNCTSMCGTKFSSGVDKEKSEHCFCINYRQLNSVTVNDAYPLSRINESPETLLGSKYFSTLDLVGGYCLVDKVAKINVHFALVGVCESENFCCLVQLTFCYLPPSHEKRYTQTSLEDPVALSK